MAPSPHLVEFYDAYTRAQAGIVSIVMEYMSGGSLQELLTHGPLTDEEQLSSIARQVMKVRGCGDASDLWCACVRLVWASPGEPI